MFLLAFLFFTLFSFDVLHAAPFDRIVEFYISSVPRPPRVDIDVEAVQGIAKTGDIIIENNRAFPQWYAMLGALVPDCRFVHAGMIIQGHDLEIMAAEISPRSVEELHVFYRGAPPRIVEGKMVKTYDWFPYHVDPEGIYVVTPEVTVNTSMSRIVALSLKDYLDDPAIGYPTKHICVIRPRLVSKSLARTLARYLTYHVIKKTSYDMGFVSTEAETAVSRLQNGKLTFDMRAAPVPLYCTELVSRALGEAGILVPTTHLRRSISESLAKIPRIPRSVLQKLDSPFIPADALMSVGTVIYQNAPPPTVTEAIETLVDLNFKAISQSLLAHFQSIAADLGSN